MILDKVTKRRMSDKKMFEIMLKSDLKCGNSFKKQSIEFPYLFVKILKFRLFGQDRRIICIID